MFARERPLFEQGRLAVRQRRDEIAAVRAVARLLADMPFRQCRAAVPAPRLVLAVYGGYYTINCAGCPARGREDPSAVFDVLVECGGGGLDIGLEEYVRKAERRHREQEIPADEAEPEAEISPFVAVHDPAGLGDALVGGPVGMVDRDVFRHRVGKRLDDAGDDQQTRGGCTST